MTKLWSPPAASALRRIDGRPRTAEPNGKARQEARPPQLVKRRLLVQPRHTVARLRELDKHFGVVSRNDHPWLRGKLSHPVLRHQVRLGVQRDCDGHVLIEVLVQVDVVGCDYHPP